MKILSEERALIVHVEYDLETESRQEAMEFLDRIYGRGMWYSRYSGPVTSEKGLIKAEVVDNISEHLQAKIDDLMFEFCPDRMTEDQIERWNGCHKEVKK